MRLVISALFALTLFSLAASLQGDHVCRGNVSVVTTKQVSFTQSYRIKTTALCWDLWTLFTCTQYKLRYRVGYRTVNIYHIAVNKSFCCEGYGEENGYCNPVCKHGCHNGGICIEPDSCQCTSGWIGNNCTEPAYAECSASCENGGWCYNPVYCNCTAGWSGQNCTVACLDGYFGRDCLEECSCGNGTCSRYNGGCSCHLGWFGNHCERECSSDNYGPTCQYNCSCLNGGQCHPLAGNCTCAPGFIGENCQRTCPSWSFGYGCNQTCGCIQQQSRRCDNVDGKCDCASGFQGSTCQHLCDGGRYGENCSMNCTCMNAATCNPFSGECHCASGYRGDRCEEVCEEGTYGDGCKQTCLCENGAKCNPVDGSCNCIGNWTGKYCKDETTCSSQWEFLSGSKCTPCYCNQENAVSCDRYGRCSCNAGWAPPNCTEECDADSSEDCEEITKSSQGNNVLRVVGIVVGIGCLLLVLIVIFVRRYQKRQNAFSHSLLEMSSVSDSEDDAADGVFSRLRGHFTNARRYDTSHRALNIQISRKDIATTSITNRQTDKDSTLPVAVLPNSRSDDSSMSGSEEEIGEEHTKTFPLHKAQDRQQRSTYSSID